MSRTIVPVAENLVSQELNAFAASLSGSSEAFFFRRGLWIEVNYVVIGLLDDRR